MQRRSKASADRQSNSAGIRRRLNEREVYRPLLLSEERQIAVSLHAKNLTYAQIANMMEISAVRARDLCRQYERQLRSDKGKEPAFERELSTRALRALLNGKYARRLSDKSARFTRLIEIAACYTRDEIKEERNVGPQTLREIEWWLARKGFSFRSPYESIGDVLEKFQNVTVPAYNDDLVAAGSKKDDANQSISTDTTA